jgi:hypothetical protein
MNIDYRFQTQLSGIVGPDDSTESGPMPHFKCVPCRTRLYSAASPTDLVGDLCPECGTLLEPVGELAEIVGFRSIKPREDAADGDALASHERIADRFDEFLDRREAIAQARLDAEYWVDDGGSFRAAAVAMPPPDTNS